MKDCQQPTASTLTADRERVSRTTMSCETETLASVNNRGVAREILMVGTLFTHKKQAHVYVDIIKNCERCMHTAYN